MEAGSRLRKSVREANRPREGEGPAKGVRASGDPHEDRQVGDLGRQEGRRPAPKHRDRCAEISLWLQTLAYVLVCVIIPFFFSSRFTSPSKFQLISLTTKEGGTREEEEWGEEDFFLPEDSRLCRASG